jgi:protein-tyrosine-phosphatase
VAVSKEFGIDLDAHHSRTLSPSLVQWAGAILCMDERDHRELLAYPEARDKVFYLGTFSSQPGDGALFIADPWSGTTDQFRTSYRAIVASVDGLADSLRDG